MPNPPLAPGGADPDLAAALLADLDAVVWELDAPTMRFTFVSDGLRRLLGHDPGDWRDDDRAWHERLHPDDRDAVVARRVRVATEGGRFDEDYRLRAADGSWVWVRDVGHAVTDERGDPTVLRGVLLEVSSRRLAGGEAAHTERRFERVVEQIPAIVYLEAVGADAATAGEMLYVSPQVDALLGFTPEEWLADPLSWARQFHPDDRARIREQYERVARTGRPLRAEYRMYTKRGEVRWFRDEAVLVRDESGTPLYWQGVMFDITAERAARERERAHEERFRELVEHIPAIVYQEDADGPAVETVYISPRMQEVLGISQEEWLADPDTWIARIHPDDREEVLSENRRVERTGDAFAMEYRMLAKDGRVVWFRDEAMPVRAEGRIVHWRGVMLDITGRKEAESQLAEAEARYRALVEQIPAITYIDPFGDGPTIYISPQSTAILGYPPEEWYAQPDLWSRIVHPEDRARLDAEPPIDAPTAASYRIVAKDGRIVWVHDTSRLILDDEGNPRFWQGVLVDVTEQHRAQVLERDLERQRDEADQLRREDEMKTTFLHAVSHDLRTPLAAILGLAVTLERDDLEFEPDEVRDLARRIAQNARKLDGLVGGFLDLERLTRGAAEPHLEPLDVGALVRELVANSELVAERRLALDVAPATIRADALMVERIVENLLSNTVKHTPGDSRIWVRLERDEAGVLLIVEDDGPGVPIDDRETIFEPFRQGSSGGPGTGVGLALVARFAELHAGRAWVEERDGGGASFRVLLAWDPSRRGDAGNDAGDADGDQTGARDPSADNHA